MPGLVTAVRWEMYILLGGLMVVVVYKLFTGGIDLSGLLTDAKGRFSPGRAQMLMATVLTAVYYLIQVTENPSTDSLPPLPATLVGILGGSHAIYLGGKARDLLFNNSGKDKSK
jgi:hypothetical protein